MAHDNDFAANPANDEIRSEPLFQKNKATSSDEIEGKIIALYSLGMSYGDIASHLLEVYGLEFSLGALTAVTAKLIESGIERQPGSMETFSPIVWLDADLYKKREAGKVFNKAVYKVLGVNLDGRKEALGLYVRWSPRLGPCPEQ
ncbi:MAG: transposase [Deltaproteobacteria bacterium]|nr:transposase [Deltaproteobacteria bacterium]